MGFMILFIGIGSWFFWLRKKSQLSESLQPYTMSKICSSNEILNIGIKYSELSGEKDADLLIQLLGIDLNSISVEDLDYRIATDFEKDRTVMINGWLLSITEARQCALYSLKVSP